MPLKLAFTAYCIAIIQLVSAQEIIKGSIYNQVTGNPVAKVSINWADSDSTISDYSGNFHFVLQPSPNPDYHFYEELMIWDTPRNLTIQITSMSGRQLYYSELTQAAAFQIPNLPSGMHLLAVTERHSTSIFKLLSRSNLPLVVDLRASHFDNMPSEEILDDRLIFHKEGFLSKDMSVREAMSSSYIGLIPKDVGELDYLEEISDPFLFNAFSTDPSRSNRGNVQEMKFVYEIENQRIYFMNSKKWNLHYDFAKDILGYRGGPYTFNSTQYFNNSNREYILGSLSHYGGIKDYVMHYVSATELTCDQVISVAQSINARFIPGQEVKLFPNQEDWQVCQGISMINSDELFEGQVYQGLTTGSTYGYLKRSYSEEIARSYFSRRDLILTDGIPNDLPVVAGIITSTPQTPLSHINVLSNSRKTPNMFLKDGFDLDSLVALEDKLVYLEVNDHDFTLREANIQEAEDFWIQNEPSIEIVLETDTETSGLLEISDLSLNVIKTVGGKAANFAEISNLSSVDIHTPEDAFAIPFYYYNQHINDHHIDTLINQLLGNALFYQDAQARKSQLELIQKTIIEAPLSTHLRELVQNRIKDFDEFDAYRFRSSTNAEDLPYFSGAGLYNSYSAKKDHASKTIENAVKKVWASLWNWRAFEERAYFKIDHLSCAMGILVHRSFPDEDANGVLITKNLYNQNPGYIINVQHGEESIVFPKKGVIHDQIILFTWSVRPEEKYMIEYLSFSNLTHYNRSTVMTDEEIQQLGDLATEIKRHSYFITDHTCDCVYDDFAVDIEFKVDSEVSPRKIYIKQARLYQ